MIPVHISLLYTFYTYAVGIRGLCIYIYHICISHWYDLWNLYIYEDIPIFCWDICDLGVKFIGKHLKAAAGKASWNINMPPKKAVCNQKSCEHSGWQLSKNDHLGKKTSNNPKAKRSKMNQKVNRTNANKLFLRHANKCHRQRSIAWPRYLSWLGFTMGALSGLRRKLFGGAQAGLGGFGIVWAFGAKVRFGSSF